MYHRVVHNRHDHGCSPLQRQNCVEFLPAISDRLAACSVTLTADADNDVAYTCIPQSLRAVVAYLVGGTNVITVD